MSSKHEAKLAKLISPLQEESYCKNVNFFTSNASTINKNASKQADLLPGS
jgi:hypothetical protein